MMETDHRPWGYYTVLADEPDHKVKRICVYPGKRLSLQRHRRRAEHWYLVRGRGGRDHSTTGRSPSGRGRRSTFPAARPIASGIPGRMEAAFIEVQTGEYFGEDDIERLADDYGRV